MPASPTPRAYERPGSGGTGCSSPALLLKREAVAAPAHSSQPAASHEGSAASTSLPVHSQPAPSTPRALASLLAAVNSCWVSPLAQASANTRSTRLLLRPPHCSFPTLLCNTRDLHAQHCGIRAPSPPLPAALTLPPQITSYKASKKQGGSHLSLSHRIWDAHLELKPQIPLLEQLLCCACVQWL